MVNELEKQFFDTFGIEPDTSESAYFTGHYNEYPQITDRILLELICLLNKYSFFDLWGEDIKELKGEILDNCISITIDGSFDKATQQLKRYKHQVQALFKE